MGETRTNTKLAARFRRLRFIQNRAARDLSAGCETLRQSFLGFAARGLKQPYQGGRADMRRIRLARAHSAQKALSAIEVDSRPVLRTRALGRAPVKGRVNGPRVERELGAHALIKNQANQARARVGRRVLAGLKKPANAE
jgi:hypothetical protein